MKTALLWVAAASCLVCSSGDVRGQTFNKAGRASFEFLKIGIGARQTAMGEAAISVVRDVNSVFWNPAGISGIRSGEASFSYTSWFADLKYIAGAVGIKWEDIGTFGFSYANLGYGDIPEALSNVSSGSSDTRTGNTFTGGDMMIGASFARQFSDHLSIGITGKFLREKLFVYAVNTYAFDVGTFYDTGFKGIRFAMSAQNFSQAVKFLAIGSRKEGYDIPLVFNIGASVDVVNAGDALFNAGENNRLTLAVQAVNSNDYGERWNIGAEYGFSDFLSLRGGYRFNYDEGGASFGVGLQKKLADFDVRVDYSFVSYQYLSSPQRLSLTLGF